jgi:predicted ATPase
MLPALIEHREVVGSHVSDIMLGFIAAAYGQAEQWDEGLRRVDEGIALSEATLEHVFAAELWRVKGELLLGKAQIVKRRQRAGADSLVGTAQQSFRRALKIARSQEARSLELRSAMSLTRLSRSRTGSREAGRLLRSLLASFTEGFDTKDLKEAQALLNVGIKRPPEPA